MNIAVGKVSDAARKAIEQAGGSIAPSLKPGVLMVTLPATAGKQGADSSGAYIDLPGHPLVTLRFTRKWHTEDCSLDIHQ
ncbi:hypothetical protein KSF_096190 [Reticulibacter mediterranei]|uniref:Uncharacterized protein n=1 Tax=Reticulibacter mediterranei TaxID=2778369 RepID=A0A8J3J0X5_9CHLR|nr:uL15m family ribosomal protein [Reticulibacter mediterranei]GHO99571.1 hypothetical protein KSF_096190 [Reticulibacter mediterranei]